MSVVHYSLRAHHMASTAIVLHRLLGNALCLVVPWRRQRLKLSTSCSVCIHHVLLLLIHRDGLGIISALRWRDFLVSLSWLGHSVLSEDVLHRLRHATRVGVAVPQIGYAWEHALMITLQVFVHVYLLVVLAHLRLLVLLALHVLVNLLLSASRMSV